MPKPTLKSKVPPAEEEEVEAEETPAEKPAEDPTAKLLKQLADQNAALQKRLDIMEKRLPKPSDEEAIKIQKQKEDEDRMVAKKAEDEDSLGMYKEILAEKFGIAEGIDSLQDAKIAMKMAKANKLDLQSLSEKMKGGNDKSDEKSIDAKKIKSPYDLTRLDQAIAEGK